MVWVFFVCKKTHTCQHVYGIWMVAHTLISITPVNHPRFLAPVNPVHFNFSFVVEMGLPDCLYYLRNLGVRIINILIYNNFFKDVIN